MERHILRLQKKKFPAKSQLKQSAEQWGSYFMLHFFSASYIRHSYITLLSRKLFFLSPVCSVQCPSVPQAGLVRSTFSLPRMNCEMYWLLKHAFLSQLGSPGYKIVAQAVNLLWYCLISHDGLIVRNSDQLEHTSSATQHLSLWMPSCAPGSHFSFKINSVSGSCRLQRKSFKCEWRINQCCAEKSLKKQF